METTNLKSVKIGFVGGGNMAIAIGSGLIRKDAVDPNNIWVSARTEKTLEFWKNLGVNTTLKNGEVVENCDVIFLAVKPFVLDEAIAGMISTTTRKINSRLFVSMLVGIPIVGLTRRLKTVVAEPRVIRCLPNTPMMVAEGITVYCHENASESDEKLVHSLFSYIGLAEKVPEDMINAIGALSGSGPAYAYLIIESLADGAVKMGVPRPVAMKFAAQVLVGAGQMVLQTGKHPGQLKDEVCSTGGSTITGVHAMERGGIRASMINAVEAAVNRSQELGAKYNKIIQ